MIRTEKDLDAIFQVILKMLDKINKNTSKKFLFNDFRTVMLNNFGITRVALYYKNGTDWENVLLSGVNYARFHDLNVEDNLLSYEVLTFLKNENSILNKFSLVLPIYHKEIAIAYLLIGSDLDLTDYLRLYIDYIKIYVNILIVAVENKRLYKENIQKDRFKNEFKLASKMTSLLIKKDKDLNFSENIRFASFYKPMYEVGGDFFDTYKLSNDSAGFCIADVSGKSVSAAILMSNLQATLNALFSATKSLSDILIEVNNRITRITQSDSFITLFIGRYNYETKELEYINAGHNPPVLYNTKEKTLHYLTEGSIAMGMLDNIPSIKEGKYILDKDSRLICFTDGIAESYTKMNLEFEHTNFSSLISNSESIEDTVKNVLDFYQKIVPEENIFDDRTILGVSFNPS